MTNPTHPPPGLTITKQTPTEFTAEDANDSSFFIGARVTGGVLMFTIVTKIPSAMKKSTIPAAAFFNAMMDHFVQCGTPITTIRAEWSDADRDMRSNLDVFNQFTAAGDNEVLAATKTFTGRMATTSAYCKVRLLHALPKGAKGKYRDVVVMFTK